jgi:hypothetical protein
MMALRAGDHIRLLTRSRADWSERFPPVVKALEWLDVKSCLIDGELVVCDEKGLAVFELLRRGHQVKPQAHLIAFDLLEIDGRELAGKGDRAAAELARLLRNAGPGPMSSSPKPASSAAKRCYSLSVRSIALLLRHLARLVRDTAVFLSRLSLLLREAGAVPQPTVAAPPQCGAVPRLTCADLGRSFAAERQRCAASRQARRCAGRPRRNGAGDDNEKRNRRGTGSMALSTALRSSKLDTR